MITVEFVHRSLFKVGIIHGILIFQANNWLTKARPLFRFLLLAIFLSQVYLIEKLMEQLTPDAWNTILGNLFEPALLFYFLVICMFGFLALAYLVAAGKVMKSLVG